MSKPIVRKSFRSSQKNSKPPAQSKRANVPKKMPKNMPAIDEMIGCFLLSAENKQAVIMPVARKNGPYDIITAISPWAHAILAENPFINIEIIKPFQYQCL